MNSVVRHAIHYTNQLTRQKQDTPAVDLVSDYSGSITTTAIPGSIEQQGASTMGRRVRTRLARSVAYTVASFPLAVLWMVLVSAIYGAIVPLVLVGIGLVLLPFALQATALAGHIERWMLREVLGEHVDKPIRLQRSRGWRGIFLTPLQDSTYWKELAFLFMRMVTAPTALLILVSTVGFGLYGTSFIIWGWFADTGLTGILGPVVAGITVLAIGALLVMAMTSLQISLAQALLGPNKAALTALANTAVHNRDLSIAAAEAERQRIERDLHDGAQARLATVALDLGRAKRRLEKQGGDAELGAIIDSAHHDAKEAIVELRNLARGIHPAVLTDRGLDAALSDVAARCSVPVHLDVHLLVRPTAPIESAAYFAVCELLTNITKHSRASQAWVTVRGDSAHIRIDVSDNGLGGVDHALGSGLLGLHDRITSLDGSFSTDSPLAGGTRALIELPLGQRPARHGR